MMILYEVTRVAGRPDSFRKIANGSKSEIGELMDRFRHSENKRGVDIYYLMTDDHNNFRSSTF